MVTDSPVMQLGESLTAAKDCIRSGAVPGWVLPCPFAVDFKPGGNGPITHLLHDSQVHAELRQTFVHVAMRLESMAAVQSQSPWRLDFEPRTQQVTLHLIQIWRNGVPHTRADLSSARVIDHRAAGSKASEPLTLSLMLADVRPGDILEWAYTVETKPLLLPEHCAALFELPVGAPVGKFHFAVTFDASRPMHWHASNPEWEPVKNENDGGTVWSWTREHFLGVPPEENMPVWCIAHPWIQVSDCADWAAVSRAFYTAWPEQPEEPAVRELAEQIAMAHPGLSAQAAAAVQLVREEFRCIAGDGELDGHVPSPPGTVAQRRYGEALDLAFLLVHLLKVLGIEARLALVNTVFRKSVSLLLPAPQVFNHVLVEYSIDGKWQWADPGRRVQAPGDYGIALPVVAGGAELAAPPAGSLTTDALEVTESILIDASGGWSWLAIVTRALGLHANALRRQLEQEGLDAFAKRRLRECALRYVTARRMDPLQYRDDPAANEFVLSEIYEIKDFLTFEPRSKWLKLQLPNAFIADSLREPDSGPRRTPFALPHPCRLVHTIELHAVSLAPAPLQQRAVKTNYLDFTRVRKTLAGFWQMKLTLTTLADSVPPADLEEHRDAIQDIRDQSLWALLLPMGEGRSHRRSDFGALPPSTSPTVTVPPVPSMPAPTSVAKAEAVKEPEHKIEKLAPALSPQSATPPEPPVEMAEPVLEPVPPAPEPAPIDEPVAEAIPAAAPVAAELDTEPPPLRHHRGHRRKRRRGQAQRSKWLLVWAVVIGVTLIGIAVLMAKHADYLKIFKRRPPPPTTDLTPAQYQ